MNLREKGIVERLAVKGRHRMISVMLLTQYYKSISPMIRTNNNLSIFFNLGNSQENEKVA